MIKFVRKLVTIVPINTCEAPRLIYAEPKVKVNEIPENTRTVLRWFDDFKEYGVNFSTGESPLKDDFRYDIGYGAYIKYDAMFNTGILCHNTDEVYQQELMLRHENYVIAVTYSEIFPSLYELQDLPADELVEYLAYVHNTFISE